MLLPSYGILTPATALLGTTRMRVICDWNNASADPCRSATYGEAEDYSVNVISNIPCNGAPAANSVVGPTYEICPGSSIGIGLASNYTVNGISYLWLASTTSSAGPRTTTLTPTSAALSVPNVTASTYFMSVISCSAGGTSSSTPYQATVQSVVTNTPPYFEGFEGITAENKLPNCSWTASNLGPNMSNQTYTMTNTNNRVPHNGSKFASFYYGTIGSSYFYTNGIYLTAGVTYSAGLWYTTEIYGYNNWTDLSIMYGSSQSTTGLTTIASSNGPAISMVYKLLSNTFQVPTTGVYYIAIKGTTGPGYAEYLSWDDLFITIPCTAESANNPTMTLTADSPTICAGETAHMTATGADTYTWSTGDMADNIYQDPIYNTTYQVIGTSALSGCTATLSQMITVNPSPMIYVFTAKQNICAGETTSLTGFGGITYTWSGSSSSGSVINVSPTSSTTYSVWGANNYGCSAMAVQAINVNQLPTIAATTPKTDKICEGESVVLSATGGSSFVWVSNTSSGLLAGANVTVSPTIPTTYTVTGTDINGCSNVATVSQNVDACTGIKESSSSTIFSVYPNPAAGEFILETGGELDEVYFVVSDVTGKEIMHRAVTEKKSTINLVNLSNGVYFLKVSSGSSVHTIKLIKQ
ncbi:MAG: T9SS type A sorting domain-containing protein [Bacteroidia bacterium]|nr:T9SS type A sorting domain-containing protein [Bacteroidia bacterium]